MAFLICFGLPAVAKADQHDHEHDKIKEYRVLEQVNKYEEGYAFVMVREGGHLLGQPYQVELRVECSGILSDPLKVKVKDSFSVCDLDPDSIKVNSDGTAIAVKAKMADVNYYDDQIAQGVSSPEMRCLEKTTIKKFSLRKLCN